MLSVRRYKEPIFAPQKKKRNIMELRDSIDFGKENIPQLFRRMLYPTLTGMLFTALFTITDGIFVGRGLGSDALAAVNITAPLFLLATGIGLMFGMGASVVASIHMGAGKIKVARLNVTQSIAVTSLLMALMTLFILLFPKQLLMMLGCSERLEPLAISYLNGFVPFMITFSLISVCGFFVRLNGAPNYAMLCSVVSAVINIALDYILIFVVKWGMFGAAVATGIGTSIGVIMMLVYLLRKNTTVKMIPIKLSLNSMILMMRNVWYMCKLGFSSFLGELAIGIMMLCGNFIFMRYMGEDGVAGFSIACYFFPIVFMIYTSIAQSAQPIISYNYGVRSSERVRQSLTVALKTALFCGLVLTLITYLFSSQIVSMFISSEFAAHKIASAGLPLFAVGFIPFAINIVVVGYFQSVERVKYAFGITVLRGVILMVINFIFLPQIIGNNGAWLAVPLTEIISAIIAIFLLARTIRNR